MRYLSVCSGIEAASVAWDPLGWSPVAFSEIEPFPSAVLAHRFPSVPNWGDMTKFQEWPDANVDVLVGGTPCQSFSVAGLRKGLADPRGNLALTYLAIADRYRPRWIVWENVFGVLSSNGGRDFGAFLGGLGQLGYGFGYRVLDAQHVRTRRHPWAVPQRRRRVFVVGYLGDWRPAAAVLFDRESLSGNPPPRREAGEGAAPRAAYGVALRGREGGATAELTGKIATALRCGGGGGDKPHVLTVAHTLEARNKVQAVAFDLNQITSKANRSIPRSDVMHTLPAAECPPHLAAPWAVRRLTPAECERLQGFPDGWTQIPWRGKPAALCPDGPRYRALGNSFAVNVATWIGERIAHVERLRQMPEAAE